MESDFTTCMVVGRKKSNLFTFHNLIKSPTYFYQLKHNSRYFSAVTNVFIKKYNKEFEFNNFWFFSDGNYEECLII